MPKCEKKKFARMRMRARAHARISRMGTRGRGDLMSNISEDGPDRTNGYGVIDENVVF